MVNASLNWASIVGIVLAVGGALLYFMRSFKPALARDYDVFFAAIGLLCGGILFFQGWRLDPILQFGQFLLAATTVFFAYESVRLRGVTTEQARRSSYFDDEEPLPYRPRGGLGGGRDWEGESGRFDEPEPVRRRIPTREDDEGDDFYRPRRTSRAAIPERAASRRPPREDWDEPTRDREREPSSGPSRYSAGGPSASPEFGSRRRDRDSGPEVRRGSRPGPGTDSMPRSSRRPGGAAPSGSPAAAASGGGRPAPPPGVPQGSPIKGGSPGRPAEEVSDADYTPLRGVPGSPSSGARGRDNSSRFDD